MNDTFRSLTAEIASRATAASTEELLAVLAGDDAAEAYVRIPA